MVVAVIAVRVVQAAIDEVVGVIAVRHRLVTAIRAVTVGAVMTVREAGRAFRGVAAAYGDPVLIDVVLVRVVQAAVMKEVRVSLVAYGRVPAARSMLVGVAVVDLVVVCH